MIDIRLGEWGLNAERYADMRADLHLVAAELVTNAVDETPDQKIRVHCVPDFKAGVLRFAVWDSSPGQPRASMPNLSLEMLDLRTENFDANGGWGLPLVEALAESCGSTPTGTGKWVWANIKIADNK